METEPEDSEDPSPFQLNILKPLTALPATAYFFAGPTINPLSRLFLFPAITVGCIFTLTFYCTSKPFRTWIATKR